MKWRLDFWKPEDSKKSPVMKELSAYPKTFLAHLISLDSAPPYAFAKATADESLRSR